MADPTVDPSNPTGEARLDENGNPIEEAPPSNIDEEMAESMKKVWAVFDSDGKDQVTIKELRTIMRALDIKVDRDGVFEEIKQMIDPDNTGFMTYARLTLVMEEQLRDTDTKEALEEQLKKLDKQGQGKIPTPEFKQYMMNLAHMQLEEVEEMIKIADPKGEGFVDIADFADSICPPKN